MKKFTFMWLIENFSYCWHNTGESLMSPTFVAETLQQTSWNLHLFLRGHDNPGFVSLYLHRDSECNGPEIIPINYTLSFADIDGRVLESLHLEDEEFEKSECYGSKYFCKRFRSNLELKGKNFKSDVLKVCCVLWMRDKKVDNETHTCVRTRIGLEKISFINIIKHFGNLPPNRKKSFEAKSASQERYKLSGKLYVKNESDSEEEVMVEISSDSEDKYLITCHIYLLNSVGKEVECGKTDTRKDMARERTLIVPLNIGKQNLLNNKLEYLSNDNLMLRFECVVSTGIDFQRNEETFYHLHLTPFLRERLRDPNIAEPKSISDDLLSLYKDEIVSDVQLKTVNKTFPAHKSVLVARSPVFRAMLTTNMREKLMGCIKIDDLDDSTLEQFLLFLYSDVVEDLQWESALNLYYAADKYNVQRLKDMCSSFLITRLDAYNICDLLILVNRHQDFSLKTDVEKFICKSKMVFRTNEWSRFMKTNPQLAMNAMHCYLKNSSN